MTARRSLLSTSVLVSESFARVALVAVVSFWIARHLGPENFGILNFASAVLAVFYALAHLGLDTPVIGDLARGAERGPLLAATISLRFLAGCMAALAMVVLVGLSRGWDDPAFVVAAIVSLSLPASVLMAFDFWFKAKNEAVWPAAARLIAALLSTVAKAACVVLGLGLVWFAWTVALEALLFSTLLFAAYRLANRGQGRHGLIGTWPAQFQLLCKAWPFFLTTVATAALLKLDVILLGILSTNKETGLYSLSQKLVETLYVVPIVVVEVLYPQLARKQQVALAGDHRAGQLYFDVAMAVTLVSVVFALLVSGWLVAMFFGSAYSRSADLFMLHAWACIGIVMIHARLRWMAVHAKEALAPWLAFCSLVIVLALSLALVPRYGATGAAVATVSGYLAAGLLLTWCFPSLRELARIQLLALWPWHRLYRHWRPISGMAG